MSRALFALLVLPAVVLAQHPERLMDLRARDLNGTLQDVKKYRGEKTLVVVMTDRDAEEAMRAWWARADQRMSPEVQRLSLISLHLPFFVSDKMARSRAREQVPKPYWDDTLLDTNGEIAKELGLEHMPVPWVFAVGRDGRVLASVHGDVGSPDAEKIWKALEGR